MAKIGLANTSDIRPYKVVFAMSLKNKKYRFIATSDYYGGISNINFK